MDKVYILVDSDREPEKAFSSMDAAKAYCQVDAASNAPWLSLDPSTPIAWEDYPEWSWGSIPNGPEWSILIMPLHDQKTAS